MDLYISENDVVQEFINECCDIKTKQEYKQLDSKLKDEYRTHHKTIYPDFSHFCKENSKENSMTKKEFFISFNKKCSLIQNKGNKFYICKMKTDVDMSTELKDEWCPL